MDFPDLQSGLMYCMVHSWCPVLIEEGENWPKIRTFLGSTRRKDATSTRRRNRAESRNLKCVPHPIR